MDFDTFCQSSALQSERSSKSTTDYHQVQELLDFSINKVSGVYNCSPEKMLFEMVEGNIISRAQLLFTSPHLNYKLVLGTFAEFSLSYYCCVYIYHPDHQTIIKVPSYRGYNPTGLIEYMTYPQFVFILKITAAMIKAAISGAAESEFRYLKSCISPLQSYQINKPLVDYMFIQVKTACYRKIMPPSLPEYICAQVIKSSLSLREDSKEYLESFLAFSKGETFEVKLPVEYYSTLLKSEKKLPWELRVAYTELESKALKNGRILKLLPQIVENFAYVETGSNYLEMNEEISKLFADFEGTVEKFNECIVI